MFRKLDPLIGVVNHCALWLTSSWTDTFVPNPNYNPEAPGQKSIYCVHGTMDRAGSFSVIAAGIKNGLPDNIKGIHLLTFGGSFTHESIESYARQLKDKIVANRDENVILMGHSRGALVVSEFAEDQELTTKNNINVTMIICICGPFKGSPYAIKPLTWVWKSVDQMQVGSQYLETLAAKITQSTLNYYFVGTENDHLVRDNAWHPYEGEGYDRENLLFIHGDAHLSVQSSEHLIVWLSALLSVDALREVSRSEGSSPVISL